MLMSVAGAEFQESVFDLIPVDQKAAEVLHGSSFEQSFRYCLEAGRKMGRNFNAAKEFKKWLVEAGFVDVVEKQYFSPVNGWPVDRKDQLIGHWCKYLDRSPSIWTYEQCFLVYLGRTQNTISALKLHTRILKSLLLNF